MNKTVPTTQTIADFLATCDERRQAESRTLVAMMQEISGEPAVMWGSSIIGFGTYTYRYASGRTGDWLKIGFSPRKAAISLYLSCDAADFADELAGLGKVTHGKGCIYLKKLEDVDTVVLRNMVEKAYAQTR
jgi:hypothetical protein